MKNPCRSGTLAVLFLLVLWALPAEAESGYGLFQQALLQEHAEGDLEEAARLYRRVVQEASDNRELVAKALVQIAGIFEKLDSPEALPVYELVAWDYADQRRPVATARARLGALGQSGRDRASLPLEPDSTYTFAFSGQDGVPIGDFSFAPDGKRFVFIGPRPTEPHRGKPQLFASDASGTWVRPLVDDTGEWHTKGARWSPDGTRVAYWTYPQNDSQISGIFLVAGEGGVSTQVGKSAQGVIEDLVWAPDGQHLTILGLDGLRSLDLEGTTTRFIPLPVKGHTTALGGYSPDGQWLAFQAKVDYRSRPALWIIPASGGDPLQVSEESDALALSNSSEWLHRPTWALDGRALNFVSDLSGSPNVWKVPLDPQSGRRTAPPVQITHFRDAGVVRPRILADGRMAFALRRQNSVVHIAQGSLPGTVRPVVRGVAPQFSANDKTIYYLGEGPNQDGIFAIPREGGTTTRLTSQQPHTNNILRGFEVSPDGSELAYQIREGDEVSLYVVSTSHQKQQPRQLITLGNATGTNPEPKWSPDGSELAFGFKEALYIIPASGGTARKIADLEEIAGWSVRWSPDGQHLAALAWMSPSGTCGVFVVPAAGGALRRLTPATDGDYKEGLEWHPDGKRLTYMNYGPDGIREAYLDGRPASRVIDQPDLWDYVGRWSPDGEQFLFVSALPGIGTLWGLYAYDDENGTTRTVWPSEHGSSAPPSFSRDGSSMTWTVTTSSTQLWLMD